MTEKLALSLLSDERSGYLASRAHSVSRRRRKYSTQFDATERHNHFLACDIANESAIELRDLYKTLLGRSYPEKRCFGPDNSVQIDGSRLIYRVLPKFYSYSELLTFLPDNAKLIQKSEYRIDENKLNQLSDFYDESAQTVCIEDIRITRVQKEGFERQFFRESKSPDSVSVNSSNSTPPYILPVKEPERVDDVAEAMITGARELAERLQKKPTAKELLKHITSENAPYDFDHNDSQGTLITDRGDAITNLAYHRRFKRYFG